MAKVTTYVKEVHRNSYTEHTGVFVRFAGVISVGRGISQRKYVEKINYRKTKFETSLVANKRTCYLHGDGYYIDLLNTNKFGECKIKFLPVVPYIYIKNHLLNQVCFIKFSIDEFNDFITCLDRAEEKRKLTVVNLKCCRIVWYLPMALFWGLNIFWLHKIFSHSIKIWLVYLISTITLAWVIEIFFPNIPIEIIFMIPILEAFYVCTKKRDNSNYIEFKI